MVNFCLPGVDICGNRINRANRIGGANEAEDLDTSTVGADKTDRVDRAKDPDTGTVGPDRADRAEDSHIDIAGADKVVGAKNPDISTTGANKADRMKNPNIGIAEVNAENDQQRLPTDRRVGARRLATRASLYLFLQLFSFFSPLGSWRQAPAL